MNNPINLRLLDAIKGLFTSGAIYDPEDNPKIASAISEAMRVLWEGENHARAE